MAPPPNFFPTFTFQTIHPTLSCVARLFFSPYACSRPRISLETRSLRGSGGGFSPSGLLSTPQVEIVIFSFVSPRILVRALARFFVKMRQPRRVSLSPLAFKSVDSSFFPLAILFGNKNLFALGTHTFSVDLLAAPPFETLSLLCRCLYHTKNLFFSLFLTPSGAFFKAVLF